MVVVLDSEEDEEASRDPPQVHDGISLGIGAREAAVLLAEARSCTKPTPRTKKGANSDSPIILSSTTSSDDEEVVDVSDEEGEGSQWIRFSRHPDRSRFPSDHSLGLVSSSESPEEQVAKKRVTFSGESPEGPQFIDRAPPTLAFTSGSASRVDVGLDAAGMWRGCGLDAGGDVAWIWGAMWPGMRPPHRLLKAF